jgi:hypothetical protein
MGLIDLWNTQSLASYISNPSPRARLTLRDANKSNLRPIFEDEGLTNTLPNPLIANDSGFFSLCYTTNGQYCLSIENSAGEVLVHDNFFWVRPQQTGIVTHTFKNVDSLRNDVGFCYEQGTGKRAVLPGDYFCVAAGNILYKAAEQTATDHHLQSAGGLKLYLQADGDGYYPVEAFGFVGDGTAQDRDRLQLACDTTSNLKFQSRIYEIGAYNPTPVGYSSHKFSCITALKDIAWRSHGNTTLRISDAAQLGQNANDISLIFMEDQNSFSAPGFIFDENASGQGYGGPIAFYGVKHIDLNNVTLRNGNPLRLGASALSMCGDITGALVVEKGFGTFAVGGKPGGAKSWSGFSATIADARGGVNLESEDVDGRGLTYVPMEARVSAVSGHSLHGGDSPMELVKIEDGCEDAVVGSIILRNASSAGTGRAAALSIKEGQSGPGPKSVAVSNISVQDAEQAVYIENGQGEIGFVEIGTIQANNTGSLLFCNRGQTGKVASVLINSVQGRIQSPSGLNSGTAFIVENNTNDASANGLDPHLEHLAIKGGHLMSVRERCFSIRGAGRVACEGLSVDATLATAPSGGYAGSVYNVIEADDIVLTNTILKGFAGSAVPLELRPKRSCRLVGLDIEANSSGTALFINGSGRLFLDNCRFSNATNAINFRVLENSFDAATVDVANNLLTIPGHVFRHGEMVRYSEGTTAISGLGNGNDYFVLFVDANSIALSATLRGAPIDLTGAGTGSARLRKALDVRVQGTRNECTSLAANTFRALSFTESGSW